MPRYPRLTGPLARLAGGHHGQCTLSGCSGSGGGAQPAAGLVRGAARKVAGEEYVIGPLDDLTIFVARDPELGASVQVRPDGRITTPLITDMPAVGKTPSMLAEDIKLQLSQFIQEPIVSVIVNKFSGTFSQQVRIVGRDRQAGLDPLSRQHDPARCDDRGRAAFRNMRAGNKARLVRFDKQIGKQKEYRRADRRSAAQGRYARQCHADAGRCDHHSGKHLLMARLFLGLFVLEHDEHLRRSAHRALRHLAPALAGARRGVAGCLIGWLVVATVPNTYESKARIFVQIDDVLSDADRHRRATASATSSACARR